MAALSITAANVVPGDGAVIKQYTAGGTITRGMAVRLSSGAVIAAVNDSAANAAAIGISLSDAGNGQQCLVQTAGQVVIGATTAVKPYVLGATGGAIMPADDLSGGGEFGTLIAMGISTTILQLAIVPSGAAAAAVA